MSWPKIKEVKLGDHTVAIVAEKAVVDTGRVVISVTATCGTVSHKENWSLPADNHEYSAVQAQKDFDTHIQKVARGAVGRLVAHEVTEALQ